MGETAVILQRDHWSLSLECDTPKIPRNLLPCFASFISGILQGMVLFLPFLVSLLFLSSFILRLAFRGAFDLCVVFI